MACANDCGSFIHPWQPESCIGAVAQLAVATAKASLPLYATLQAISGVFKLPKCKSQADLKRLLVTIIKSSLRSSAFITSLASALVAAICALRAILGRHYASTTGAIPAALASITLLLEDERRRRDLAVYVATQAIRILATKMVSVGVLPAVPCYEVVLMSISMALLQRLRLSSPGKGLVGTLLKAFVPSDEQTADTVYAGLPPSVAQYLSEVLQRVDDVLARVGLRTLPSDSCSHEHSCLATTLGGIGHGAILASSIKLCSSILSLVRGGRARKGSSSSLWLLCMLLPSLARGCRCLLRHTSQLAEVDIQTCAGAVCGLAFFFNRSAGLSSYAVGKAADLWVQTMVADGRLSPIPHAAVGLFSAAAAVIVHFAVFDEQQLPSSYQRFLNDVTGGLFSQINPAKLTAAQVNATV